MALPVKDGSGVLTSLKTTLTGSDHMPHHIVQAVSGTVVVTSSASSPIYVTSSNAMTITASSANPVAVSLQTNALALGSGIPVTASSTYPVYVTGAVSISQPVSVDVVVGDNIFVTSSITAPLYVSSSANSPVSVTGTINAAGPFLSDIKDRLTALTFTFQGSGGQNYVLVTSSATAPLYISSSANSPVLVTGTVNLASNIVTASIGASTYTYSGGTALVVRTTASSVTLEGINTVISSVGTPTTGVAVGLIGQDNSVRLYNSTSSVTSSQTYPLYVTGSVYSNLIDNTVRVSSSSGERVWITGSVTSNASVTVSDGLKVELSGTNVKQISGSSANTYLQTSIAAVATESVLRIYVPPNWGGEFPPSDPKVIGFDWSSPASGSVNAASASVNRKSLTIFNDSPHSIYMMIGLPWGAADTNGFSLYSTGSKPNMSSFILYPSGTYFAEPHNVGMKHGMYLISSSVNNETKIYVTETY